jgi:undecaprenyl diphosphate synthase
MNGIDPARLPGHIAIIMDGNGRWAERHAMGRIMGHRRGADAVRAVTTTCRKMGIRCLTLYAFSMENWLRPKAEVQALMNLLRQYLEDEVQEMMDRGIRLKVIGNLASVDRDIRDKLSETVGRTSGNAEMLLTLALSYGGRDEIAEAARGIAQDALAGRIGLEEITRELFAGYLNTRDMPDPDLLIRTGGEYRVSNFLLWQMAYTEFYFTDILWPDFREKDLLEAIAEYQRRERRFGMISGQLGEDTRKGGSG